jgi:hypothetical protein
MRDHWHGFGFFGSSACFFRLVVDFAVRAVSRGINQKGVARIVCKACKNLQESLQDGLHFLPSTSSYSPRLDFVSQPASMAFLAMREMV